MHLTVTFKIIDLIVIVFLFKCQKVGIFGSLIVIV